MTPGVNQTQVRERDLTQTLNTGHPRGLICRMSLPNISGTGKRKHKSSKHGKEVTKGKHTRR